MGECANAGTVDGDDVARPEGKRLVRHDARAREQHRADPEGERGSSPAYHSLLRNIAISMHSHCPFAATGHQGIRMVRPIPPDRNSA
jgi:hypothetical protein